MTFTCVQPSSPGSCLVQEIKKWADRFKAAAFLLYQESHRVKPPEGKDTQELVSVRIIKRNVHVEGNLSVFKHL